MNGIIFVLRVLTRVLILGVFYLLALFIVPNDPLLAAVLMYLAYLVLAWTVVLLHRASLHDVHDLKLGPVPPRFVTPSGIVAELEFIIDKVRQDDENFAPRSPLFPSEFDLRMDDVVDSLSRMQPSMQMELFRVLSEDSSNIETTKYLFSPFWMAIMRLASRAVRDKEPKHIVRGIYAAQAALAGGADYRDVLVSYSPLWDAARRIRTHIRAVAKEIAVATPDLYQLLSLPPAGIKSMAITVIRDQHGFRYDYDETWPADI